MFGASISNVNKVQFLSECVIFFPHYYYVQLVLKYMEFNSRKCVKTSGHERCDIVLNWKSELFYHKICNVCFS